MSISIIISDGVLSLVAFYSAYILFSYVSISGKISATGIIMIIGITSFTGYINHFGVPQTAFFGFFFGGLCNFLGVPLSVWLSSR